MNTQLRPAIVFDLDGTLWDASRAISLGWNAAWLKLKEEQKDRDLDFSVTEDQIRSVAGLVYQECVKRVFAPVLNPILDFESQQFFHQLCTELEVAERESVKTLGGVLFPGTAEVIRSLSEKKYSLYLVSNCQTWYLETFLEKSGLGTCFKDSFCVGRPGKDKRENMEVLKEKYRLKNPIYVGDTIWDQRAAYFSGYRFLFAQYGFGTVNELRTPTINQISHLPKSLDDLLEKVSGIDFRCLPSADFSKAQLFYESLGYNQKIDAQDQFFVAENEGQIIAQVRLAQEFDHWVLRGMQVKPQFQFQGIGTRLLKNLQASIVEPVYCLPYAWLKGFYGQVGFKEVELKTVPEFLQQRCLKYQNEGAEIITMKREC